MLKGSLKRVIPQHLANRGIRITVHDNYHQPLKRGQCIIDQLKPNHDAIEKVSDFLFVPPWHTEWENKTFPFR